MTESDWLTTIHPTDLLKHRLTRDDRKRRLLDCACVRRVLHFLTDPRLVNAVAATEDLADGIIDWDRMKRTARRDAMAALRELRPRLRSHYSRYAAEAALGTTNREVKNEGMYMAGSTMGYTSRDYHANLERELTEQVKLVRDIFGNPFRPVAFDPEWRTSSAIALAGQMYESRDFAHMPILADALQDAGCEHADVLAHCRGPGPHVRGCWVVDLVLGKG
jgi:hypothetical protein